jgi:hypothetical protein
MKKLILTLFLASASLVSFAQSTVKTIRIADATTVMTANLPTGTMVVDVANKDLYVATVGVSLTGNAGAAYNLTNGLAAGVFVKVNGSLYSVIDEAVGGGTSSIKIANSQPADGADIAIEAKDFKVFVNGSLLLTSAYTFVTDAGVGSDENGIEITAGIYEFDQVSVVYNTIK